MEIRIRNVAKVRKADIECQGLTAIIGDNDTGKSTVGKVLYSFFHTFMDLDSAIRDARAGYVLESVKLPNVAMSRSILSTWLLNERRELSEVEFEDRIGQVTSRLLRRQRLSLPGRMTSGPSEDEERELQKNLSLYARKAMMISADDLMHDALTMDLNRYFNDQFLPNYAGFAEASEVTLRVQGQDLSAWWGDPARHISLPNRLRSDAWFIGTPLVMDALGRGQVFPRASMSDEIGRELVARLRRYRPRMTVARHVANIELAPVYDMLNRYFSSMFSTGERGELNVSVSGMAKPLNVANLSMGIKMMALLTLMIEANVLKVKDVLILDEPENHLHPELQVVFAEAIVRLQRIYDLTVLVTTHSPYFLQALELAARRLKAETGRGETLKVYQPRIVDERLGRVDFDDVSGNTSDMYRKFARTMRDLDGERLAVEELEKSTSLESNQND